MTLVALVIIALQEAPEDTAVGKAVKATIEKGAWAFRIVPRAALRDALPGDAATVAGTPVEGVRTAAGTYRATDGKFELFGRGAAAVLRTPDGCVNAAEAAETMRREVEAQVGKSDEERRNVTRAKEVYRNYLALLHLYVHAAPPEKLLARAATDLRDVKKTSSESLGGMKCAVHAGAVREAAAKALLLGPYAEAVKSGAVTIEEASGRGRVWIGDDGLVRRVELTVAGKFMVVGENGGRRAVPVALAVTCDVTKLGEATLDVPAAVERLLQEAEAPK